MSNEALQLDGEEILFDPPRGCVLALAIMCAWYAACILAWCW